MRGVMLWVLGCAWSPSEPVEPPPSIDERTADRIEAARRFARQPFLPHGGHSLWASMAGVELDRSVFASEPAPYAIGGLPPQTFSGSLAAGAGAVDGWSIYYRPTDLGAGPPVLTGFSQVGADCARIESFLRETYGKPVAQGLFGWIWDAVTYEVELKARIETRMGPVACVVMISIKPPEEPPAAMLDGRWEVHWYRPKLDPERRGVFGRAWHDAVQRFLTDQPVPRYSELTDVEQEELRKTLTALRLPFESPVQWLERPPPEEFPGRIGRGPRPRAWPWKLRIYEGPPPRPPAE